MYYDDSYEYQGGAHGISGKTYTVYNIATGRRVTEDDIFVMNDENEKALSEMIVEAFAVEFSDEKDDMWNEGINFINGNFSIGADSLYYQYSPYEIGPYASIGADSLYYQYSPYEIGPYAMGMPRVALHKEAVKPFLKKDGVLYEYWFPEKKKK